LPSLSADSSITYLVPPVIPVCPPSLRQKLLYVLLHVGFRYVWARLHPVYQTWSAYPPDHWKRKFAQLYQFLETSYRALAMVNFIVFLSDGRYRDVLDRILGIRLVYLRSRVMRQVAFDFMNQQLVWQGFSEFFVFVLPFINFERIRSWIRKLLRLSSDNKAGAGCPVCRALPTTPYQANCGHVFCYYCLHASRLQDDMFRCPSCDVLLRSQTPYLNTRTA
jgi:peroxin-2